MTLEEQQKLTEMAELYDSLSPTLKQIFVSQIPYGTIQNTSNASSHIDVLKEESKEMVECEDVDKYPDCCWFGGEIGNCSSCPYF